MIRALWILAAWLGLGVGAGAAEPVILASTTSTDNSGLFGHILPMFSAATGHEVRVIAVGTGQALRLGRHGDADVVLVHDRAAEAAFVANGYGVARHEVMYNDFVIVGPAADPADIAGMSDAAAALARIASNRATFVSRGDDGGTHRRELALWRSAGIDPVLASGTWYLELGAGMGATLNTAQAIDAHGLADRGTWLSFANKGGLRVLVEGDAALRNPYGVILVNPERHPHVNLAGGTALIDWLLSAEGQAAIGAFTVDGEVLFHPLSVE